MIRSLSSLPSRRLLLSPSSVHSRSYSPPQRLSSVEEHPEAVEGKVKGTIPQWLSGRLIRNGPGLFEIGDTKYNHLFDGLSLLHSFTIDQGKVQYQSRFLRSETYKKNMAANRIVVSEFGTAAHADPCKTLFQRMFSMYQALRDPSSSFSDNCAVNVIPIGDELIAATETDYVHQISSETLDSVQRHQLSKNVAVNGATAHAHQDLDGTVYNLGNSFADGAMYNVIKIRPPLPGEQLFSNTSVLSTIPAKDKYSPGYYHSFGMTDNYIVFMEQPLKLELRKFPMFMLTGKPFSGMLTWNPDENVRFYVIDKATGKVVDRHFSAPACFVFHHINAYEQDGHIVVDVCALNEGNIAEISLDSLDTITEGMTPYPRRYVLPLNAGTEYSNLITLKDTTASASMQPDGSILCTHEKLCPIPFEFPQINYKRFNGRKYNFVYGVTFMNGILNSADILKLNVNSGTTKCWSETDCSPSEPVFVPHPNAQAEDDGVLLSAVLHTERKKAPFLIVLDAKTMDEVGRVQFEGIQMHKDFHGIFCEF